MKNDERERKERDYCTNRQRESRGLLADHETRDYLNSCRYRAKKSVLISVSKN
jgi:hypothetical protein